MNACELLIAERRFDRGYGASNAIHPRADMKSNVIVSGLDPIDLGRIDEHHPIPGALDDSCVGRLVLLPRHLFALGPGRG